MGGFTFYIVSLDHVPQYSSCHRMLCDEIVMASNIIKRTPHLLAVVNVICVYLFLKNCVGSMLVTQFCMHAGTLFVTILMNYETDKIETLFCSFFL